VFNPSARSSHGMAYDSVRDRVVLFGGFAGGPGGAPLNDTWVPNRELLRGARGFSRRPA
jgi:hypothetical protein